MRLRTKLLFLFLGSGAFLLAEGLVAAWGLRTVGRDVDRLERHAQIDDLCGQVKAELARLPDPPALVSERGRARAGLRDHADRAVVLCRGLARLTAGAPSRAAVAQVEQAVARYRAAGLALAEALEGARAGFDERDEAERAHRALVAAQEEGALEPVVEEARRATQAVVQRAARLDRWVTFVGLGLSITLTLVASVVLAKLTAYPVVKLLRAARQVGEGRLDTVVEVRTTDELGELARAFNDMTRRLRDVYAGLEAEVRKRTDELRRRERELERERRLAAVGRLAAGVAHEVSNPLTVIASAAEGLRDRARDPALAAAPAFADFPDYLEAIEEEAYRLKRVVRRLLDFSRGQPAVALPLDLAGVVDDAVALARLDPRARAHPVRWRRPPSPLPVTGDPDALKDAVLNLLFNALHAVAARHAPAGEAGAATAPAGEAQDPGQTPPAGTARRGEVRVRALAAAGSALIEVEDDGVGIDPADLERVFEPFFTTGKEGEGTGLGLALVHGTADRHGGSIRARSPGPGQGACFVLALPLRADPGGPSSR